MGNCQADMVRVHGKRGMGGMGRMGGGGDTDGGVSSYSPSTTSSGLLPPSDRRFEDPTRDVPLEGALAFANHSTMWGGGGRKRPAKEVYSIWGEAGPPLHLVEHQGKVVRFREVLESHAPDGPEIENESWKGKSEKEEDHSTGVLQLLSLGIPRRDPKCVHRLIWRNDTVFPIRYG
eukprot:TRINITY_DN362_c1_g1_i2.p1 TRINITY_DN362_c1_g1~~TRINITY_DN362_c1_g1_i2.p1  ORF type:complete len:176 (-),score=47.25 TRINITY_DN362_c1_g1_i2:516-1043(-)